MNKSHFPFNKRTYLRLINKFHTAKYKLKYDDHINKLRVDNYKPKYFDFFDRNLVDDIILDYKAKYNWLNELIRIIDLNKYYKFDILFAIELLH